MLRDIYLKKKEQFKKDITMFEFGQLLQNNFNLFSGKYLDNNRIIDAFAKNQNIGTAQQKAPEARRANNDE